MIKQIIFSLLIIVSLSSFNEKEEDSYYNYSIPLEQLVPQPTEQSKLSILIQKSSYKLFVKYDNRVVKAYPCVFGKDPIGDKRMEGDMRTPEGNFYVTGITDHFIWDSFIKIDYPNHHSYNKHFEAKSNAEIPDSVGIGGDIGIHGVVDGWEDQIDSKINWTEGCIALKNKDISEIVAHIGTGTPIKIVY